MIPDIPDGAWKRRGEDSSADAIGSRAGPDRLASGFVKIRTDRVLIVVDILEPLHFTGHAQIYDELLEESTTTVQNVERILPRKQVPPVEHTNGDPISPVGVIWINRVSEWRERRNGKLSYRNGSVV